MWDEHYYFNFTEEKIQNNDTFVQGSNVMKPIPTGLGEHIVYTSLLLYIQDILLLTWNWTW